MRRDARRSEYSVEISTLRIDAAITDDNPRDRRLENCDQRLNSKGKFNGISLPPANQRASASISKNEVSLWKLGLLLCIKIYYFITKSNSKSNKFEYRLLTYFFLFTKYCDPYGASRKIPHSLSLAVNLSVTVHCLPSVTETF